MKNSVYGMLLVNSDLNDRYVCSDVEDIRKNFAQRIKSLHNQQYFISEEFLDKLNKDSNFIKGGLLCLPQEIHPSLSVCAVRKLLLEIEPICETFLNDLLKCAYDRISLKINDLCNNFRGLIPQLMAEFDVILKEHKVIADKQLKDALESEHIVIYTDNDFYSIAVNAIEHLWASNAKVAGHAQYFGFADDCSSYNEVYKQCMNRVTSSSNNNNQELLLVKQAIKIGAYWKTLCQAFVDRIVKMAQLYLIVHPLNDRVLLYIYCIHLYYCYITYTGTCSIA